MNKVRYISERALVCFKENFSTFGTRQQFPRNCCEEASIILNAFLKENNILNFKLMRGTNIDGAHHFWLESEASVIDLTAHQFNDIYSPIILAPKNEYPLISIFSEDIHEFTGAPWPYLDNELFPEIKQAFYTNYF